MWPIYKKESRYCVRILFPVASCNKMSLYGSLININPSVCTQRSIGNATFVTFPQIPFLKERLVLKAHNSVFPNIKCNYI